jgi:phospholipid N-methyltransferase
MPNWFTESRTFLRQYRTNFKHTGAVLPSGRLLGHALTRYVREPVDGVAGSRRILEVGPGTGAVTRHICASLGPADSLDLCELNDAFVEVLRQRLAAESPFCDVADRTAVHHSPIEALPADKPFDLIVSGLPLNNFEVGEVEHILGLFARLLKPTGVLSFFEYIAIRKMRAAVGGPAVRTRLKGIERAMDGVLQHEIRRDRIWANVPPAYVHHVRCGGRA